MLKQELLLRKTPVTIFLSFLLMLFTSFTTPSVLEKEVLFHTNQFRQSKGKMTLILKADLSALARKHSEDMARKRVSFGHDGFNQRYSKVKKMYASCTMSENVAFGVSTGREAVKIWQNSSSHRANMLGNYKYIGIGTAKDSRGRIYYTQIFVR